MAEVDMRKPVLRTIFGLVAMLVLISVQVQAEQVSFSPAGQPSTYGASLPAAIPATLSLPRNAVGRVPAVVIAHGSAGLIPSGPEPNYVAALNEARIATLVIDMWTP